MKSVTQKTTAGSPARGGAGRAAPWAMALAELQHGRRARRRARRCSGRASPISARLADETILYLLTLAGSPGMTRSDLVAATGMTIKQVEVATRRMGRWLLRRLGIGLHAIGSGYGWMRTVRWSLVRAAIE